MKSFKLHNVQRLSNGRAIAYTNQEVSPKINVTNEYMLFDDGFIRREHASENEPSQITVFDIYGDSFGTFRIVDTPQKGLPCVWSIDEDPDKELVIRRLKAIEDKNLSKEYFRWLMANENISSDKKYYLLGQAYRDGYGPVKNFLKATNEFKKGIDEGNSACIVAYADLLLKGWFGQQPDVSKAISFLEAAIGKKNICAKSHLVNLYFSHLSLPDAQDKALSLGNELRNTSEEIILCSVIKSMAEYYSTYENLYYNKENAIELYATLDEDISSKELAFMIVDSEKAGIKESRAKLEKKAFDYLKNNNDLPDKNGEDTLRRALLIKCYRLGIGTVADLSHCRMLLKPVSKDECGIINSMTTKMKSATYRRSYESLLVVIDEAKNAIINSPLNEQAFRKYGDLLKYLKYLGEYSIMGMPQASDNRLKLSEFIAALGNEYAVNHKRIVAEDIRREEEYKRNRLKWEEEERQRELRELEQKRIKEEADKAERLREQEEKRAKWEAELAEKLRTGEWVMVTFKYDTVLKYDDFDDSPQVLKNQKQEILNKEEYLSLLSGGERAIIAYVQALVDDSYYNFNQVIAAKMIKEIQ